jgi:hypothetical protein
VRLSLLACLALAAGCSSHSPVDPDDGRRLVPWQLEVEGAPPLVLGLYDAQEKTHCRFLPDEAGQLRCLPTPALPVDLWGAFSDPGCQHPIYKTSPGRAGAVVGQPVALPLPTALDCPPERFGVGVLRSRSASEAAFDLSGSGECSPIMISDGALTIDAFEAPDRWATGEEVDGPLLSDRLRVRQIDTSGTRVDERVVDARWDAPCSIVDEQCRPLIGLDVPLFFEDPQCQGVPLWPAFCDDTVLVEHSDRSLHTLGPAWDGPVYSSKGGCLQQRGAAGPNDLYGYVEEGPAVGADAIATVSWVLAGKGRFLRRAPRGTDGTLVPLGAELLKDSNLAPFQDTMTKLPCRPIWTPEGLVRCVSLPLSAPMQLGYFADAGCTTPAFPSSLCDRCNLASGVDEAGGMYFVESISVAKEVRSLFSKNMDTCVPMPDVPPGMFFTQGDDPLPWSQFPVIAERNGWPKRSP